MPRLFVAIAPTPAIASCLAQWQPRQAAGIKLTTLAQFHLTLHFIGEADVQPVAQALQQIKAATFSIKLDKLGRFHSHNGGNALWAGVQQNPQLLDLHDKVLAALSMAGLKPKVRAYTPHITLARCKPEAPGNIINDFLMQDAEFPSAPMPVSDFALYSSILTSEGSQYTREHSFPLQKIPDVT
ncbi:RNA 2',3'-cyclic phosphodiesterase [Undibacterium terreum]|uniref:RNA 2',3'-cyclic phosphodiesterase n=1 Tax=Undibacterium terreum TaxID=1224302 RepID=A0A916XPX5_9BURK|nr:RNA 2',3'-cyclic phosphodiesterase [Undibacterium terreum]GGC90713.1 RNA 2',3'-cyclic phosphodiesterase [Undibacterium terreum]